MGLFGFGRSRESGPSDYLFGLVNRELKRLVPGFSRVYDSANDLMTVGKSYKVNLKAFRAIASAPNPITDTLVVDSLAKIFDFEHVKERLRYALYPKTRIVNVEAHG